MNGLRIVLIFSFFHDGIFNFNNIIISIAESNMCKLKKSYKKEKSENFTLDSVIRLTIYAVVSIRLSYCLLILNICSQMASYLVQWFNRKWHQQRVCLLSFFFSLTPILQTSVKLYRKPLNFEKATWYKTMTVVCLNSWRGEFNQWWLYIVQLPYS